MMAANLYCAQIEDLMFEVQMTSIVQLSAVMLMRTNQHCKVTKFVQIFVVVHVAMQ
jgi:hypothetical protein